MARNVKCFSITGEQLAYLITPKGDKVWFRCEEGIPDGSTIIAAQYDLLTNRFKVLVSHESFPDCPDGCYPEEIRAIFRCWHLVGEEDENAQD